MDQPPRRPLLLPLVIVLVAFGPISTDLYLPALPRIGEVFAAGPESVQLTLSVFLAGFAAGMLVYGPLSDRFGRRPVLIGGILVYLLATLACALAQSIEWLIAARFLQALGACCGPVLGRAVVRDLYGPSRAAQALSYVAMAMAVAPAAGPVLGGVVTQWADWWANFVLLLAFGGLALAGVLAILPETNRYRDPTATQPRRLVANYLGLLRNRTYLGYVVTVGAGYGGIFAFISGSAFALIGGLGLTPLAYGFCFAAVVGGYMIGSFASARLHGRVPLDGLVRLGNLAMLAGGLAGAALALAGLWSVAAIVLPTAFYLLGCGLVMPNAQAGAIGPFPRMAGAAAAMLGFLQMSAAALLGIVVGQFQDGSPTAMMLAILLSGAASTAAHRWIVPRRTLDRAG